MNCNARMLELSHEWLDKHPNATEEERKDAFDKIAGHVVRELMRGYKMPLDLGTLA